MFCDWLFPPKIPPSKSLLFTIFVWLLLISLFSVFSKLKSKISLFFICFFIGFLMLIPEVWLISTLFKPFLFLLIFLSFILLSSLSSSSLLLFYFSFFIIIITFINFIFFSFFFIIIFLITTFRRNIIFIFFIFIILIIIIIRIIITSSYSIRITISKIWIWIYNSIISNSFNSTSPFIIIFLSSLNLFSFSLTINLNILFIFYLFILLVSPLSILFSSIYKKFKKFFIFEDSLIKFANLGFHVFKMCSIKNKCFKIFLRFSFLHNNFFIQWTTITS